MSAARRVVPVILLAVVACGDESAGPPASLGIDGRYALAWTARQAAPTVTIVPGVPLPVDDCGSTAPPGWGAFTFSDSTALTIQESPQAYALVIVGRLTDCAGEQTRHFDVVVGDYLLAGEGWITLAGDPIHPNFDGQIVRGADSSVTVIVRPGQPGLAPPLGGLDRMVFTRP